MTLASVGDEGEIDSFRNLMIIGLGFGLIASIMFYTLTKNKDTLGNLKREVILNIFGS